MAKDDNFWLNAFYIVFTLIMAYLGFQLVNTLGVQFNWVERYDTWFPLANNISALVIGIASTLFLKSDSERVEYYLASIAEMRKVAWPTYEDTKRMTVVVVIVVLIFAVILGVFDFAWSNILKQILT